MTTSIRSEPQRYGLTNGQNRIKLIFSDHKKGRKRKRKKDSIVNKIKRIIKKITIPLLKYLCLLLRDP